MDAAIASKKAIIDSLTTKMKTGKLSESEQSELKKLLEEVTAWRKSNPSKAASMDAVDAINAKSPAQLKTEYEEAAKPKPVTPTADQNAAANARLNPTPPVSERSKAMGQPPAPQPAPQPEAAKPAEDSAERHYTAMGEAVEQDYKDFALHMRGLADKGELVDADGKPLPMYSKEKIDGMSIPELKEFVSNNPKYARDFFVEPSDDVKKQLEGSGRTGVGEKSGMVEIQDATDTPKTDAVKPTEEKPEAAETPAVEQTIPKEEIKEAVAQEEPNKGESFGEMLKRLGTDWGVPFLEIVQAVGYQRGGIDKPTRIEQKYQEKLDKEEREYAKKLEEEKVAREDKIYNTRVTDERAWQTQQAELNRLADKEARGEELSSREKIARMQIEAQRAAIKSGGSASIIPE